MRGWQSSPPAPSHKAFPLLFPLATSAPNPLGYLHAQRGPWWGSVKFCVPPRQDRGLDHTAQHKAGVQGAPKPPSDSWGGLGTPKIHRNI